MARFITPLCTHKITYDPDLLLRGLMILYSKIRTKMRKASLPNEINVHSAFLFRIVLPTVAVYTFRLKRNISEMQSCNISFDEIYL